MVKPRIQIERVLIYLGNLISTGDPRIVLLSFGAILLILLGIGAKLGSGPIIFFKPDPPKHIISFGTHIISMPGIFAKVWVNPDGSECARVYDNHPIWIANAMKDPTQNYYFNSQSEADSWITNNWCK